MLFLISLNYHFILAIIYAISNIILYLTNKFDTDSCPGKGNYELRTNSRSNVRRKDQCSPVNYSTP